MKEWYAKYQQETFGRDVLYFEGGFIAYAVEAGQFYIGEFYLDPDFRHSPKHFLSMMERCREIALAKGAHQITGHVMKCMKGFEDALAVRLKLGFKIISLEPHRIGLALEIA